jgi:alkyl hydroperoxide reductase subunit AhpC
MLVGQRAPDFTLEGVVGRGDFTKISLSDFRGKWVVLFFYPLDFTSVCPTEVLGFSKREGDFKRLNAAVVGCSTDSVHSHKAWITANLGPLSYPLLSDIKREVCREYDCLIEDKGYATRATFIIDPEGVVQYAALHNTDIGRSVSETLRVLEALATGDLCPADWKRGEQTLGR